MKKRVNLSGFAFTITIAFIILISALIWVWFDKGETIVAVICLAALCLMCIAGLIYGPISISLKNGILTVHSSLNFINIPVSDIESVKLCPPTMGARRIVGSAGFMGYWGWFREKDLGKYFAYYGKASDCFLITLRNGRKYMLGCKDAPEMVEAIQSQLDA